MRSSSIVCAAALAVFASAKQESVSWDAGYDVAERSLASVTCSDGQNGLMHRFPTQGQLPTFPRIGGASAVAGWNSPSCGTCWQLEHNGTRVNVLAIDTTGTGFNIGKQAMNLLTHGRAVELGRVNARVTQLEAKECGL